MAGYKCNCLVNQEKLDILFVLPWFGIRNQVSGFKILPGIGAEYPITIVTLMAHLEKQGFKTGIIDMNIETRPLETLELVLKICKPKTIGISSYSENIANAESVAEKVKNLQKDIPVILGGFHASAMPEECLVRYPCFDYVMYGESEHSLPILLTKLLNHVTVSDVPNLAYRSNGGVSVNPPGPGTDLDTLPFPLIEKLDFNRYTPLPPNYYTLPTIGLMSSRGCPFKCTFCATHFQWNKNIRRMSSVHIVDWIEKFIVDYVIRDFRFYDDTFTIPRHSLFEFCEEVLRRDLDIHWNCYSRVDSIDEPMVKIMKRAGCYHIKFGIEAGTQKSLERIKKGITLEQAFAALQLVKSYGIETKGSFILGIHDETLEDSKKTIELALRLELDYVTFGIMCIYPGSEDYNTWKTEGRIPENFNWHRSLYATNKDSEDFQRLLKQAYRKFYFRPKFFMNRFSALVRNPGCEIIRDINAAKYLWV